MRISEEVDALEVMAIPSMPFLVTTRIVGGLIAVIPLYVVGLLSSYFAARLVVTQFFGQCVRHLRLLLQRSSCHRATCCGRSARCSSSRSS